MKIRPVGAELFHADGQTDRHDEANIRTSKFCECVQKCKHYYIANPAYADIKNVTVHLRSVKLTMIR